MTRITDNVRHLRPLVLGLILLGCAPALLAEPSSVPAPWQFRALEPLTTSPALDGLEANDIELVLDDGTTEGALGVGTIAAQQFLWFQVFAAPADFDLKEVWVLFPSDPAITPGSPVQLVIYQDEDTDPSSGATLLRAVDAVVQVADGQTFSIYPLAERLEFRGGGNLLLGVVNRFVTSGVSPSSQPAALDTTGSQQRAWVATWTTDPPDPPHLPSDESLFLVDDLIAGNWMIRGFGVGAPVVDVPTLNTWGGIFLALLLATVAIRRLHRGPPAAPVLARKNKIGIIINSTKFFSYMTK